MDLLGANRVEEEDGGIDPTSCGGDGTKKGPTSGARPNMKVRFEL